MRRLLPLLAVVLFVTPARAQGPVDLHLRLDVGDAFSQRMTAQQEIEQTVMGSKQTIKQTIGMTTRYAVEAASDSIYGVRAVYTAVRYDMDGPMGSVRYDSADPPAEVSPAAAGYAALVGQGFSFTVSPMGHVYAVEGVEAMIDAVIDALEAPDEAQREAIRASLQAQFGDEAIRGQLANTFAHYPGEPVSVGDTWRREVSLRAGMPMDLTNTYRLEAIEDGAAVIAVSSQIETGDGPPMSMAGAEIAFDLDGTQTGTLRLDPDTGMVRASTFDQNLAGEAVVNGAMTRPMTIASTIAVETVD